MSLFTILPNNFFSILASKNKEIYAEALLLLFQSIEDNDLLIKKSEYIRSLKDRLTEVSLNLIVNVEEDPDDEEEMINHAEIGRAHV